jgi:hypothetical protein
MRGCREKEDEQVREARYLLSALEVREPSQDDAAEEDEEDEPADGGWRLSLSPPKATRAAA